MKYKLSADMYWLPAYEDRYAVKFLSPQSQISSIQLYSFVSPGSVGHPYPLSRTASGKWTLTKRGARWKNTFGDDEIIRFIKASPAYKKAQQEHLTHMMPKTTPSKPDLSIAYDTEWVIGDLTTGKINFSSDPKAHSSEKEAYAEAERLAVKHPGTSFVVFKAVRHVVSGKTVTVDL